MTLVSGGAVSLMLVAVWIASAQWRLAVWSNDVVIHIAGGRVEWMKDLRHVRGSTWLLVRDRTTRFEWWFERSKVCPSMIRPALR